MLNDGIIHDDTYRLFVPIENGDELLKSVQVDENGDYIVQGVMTSEDNDEEDDSITPEGMDCSYFLEKGWIKYEHGNNPNQFIGEPLEVKVGQFEHPTSLKLVKGIFVKGRLFAQRELSKQAVRTIEDLQKSNTKRKMGWSIEGSVKERDRKTGKIIKSILRNVVLTMNPVNTQTWAELSKSFAKNHELTIDMGDVEKSMDIAGAAAITPQSIEGYDPKKDEQQKWIDLFRSFVKGNLLSKSLRNEFVASTAGAAGMGAYSYALTKGLDNEGAYEFASYISDNHEALKSLFRVNFGGGNMSKLASILDTDLEELQKAIEMDDEELNKSVDTEDEDGDKNKKDNDDEEDGDNDDDEDGEDDNDEEDGDNDDDEDGEDDKKIKKSIKTDFAKSLAANEDNAAAFEVSDFLTNLVDEIGFSMDGMSKSLTMVTKQNNAIVKALMSVGELTKGLTDKIETLEAENADLKKSFEDLLQRPVGRKSVVSTKEANTLTKSTSKDTGAQLNRAQMSDILFKSFEAGEISGTVVSRFEAGVALNQLGLPQGVKDKLGLI